MQLSQTPVANGEADNMRKWIAAMLLSLTLGALASPATSQERCFQEGESVCKQFAPDQPAFLHTCERYRDGLRLTFKGIQCQAQMDDEITGTWAGTQNCGGEIDDIEYELEATSATTFRGTWEDMNGAVHPFQGTKSGNSVTWRDMDSTYRLSLSGRSLTGVLIWGTYPKPCQVQMTKVD
jgi:hypothetical protein